MFITFFPHLIAGPIVRYREIYPQFNRRSVFRLAAANVTPGLMIFAIGLFKKVIIADTFRDFVEPIYDGKFPAPAFADAWGATLAFACKSISISRATRTWRSVWRGCSTCASRRISIRLTRAPA